MKIWSIISMVCICNSTFPNFTRKSIMVSYIIIWFFFCKMHIICKYSFIRCDVHFYNTINKFALNKKSFGRFWLQQIARTPPTVYYFIRSLFVGAILKKHLWHLLFYATRGRTHTDAYENVTILVLFCDIEWRWLKNARAHYAQIAKCRSVLVVSKRRLDEDNGDRDGKKNALGQESMR